MTRFKPSSQLGERVAAHRDELLAAAERLGLEDVRVFGSVSRGDDSAASDLDLLVHRRAGSRALSVISLEEEAEALLGVSVDVVSDTGLGARARDEILTTAVQL